MNNSIHSAAFVSTSLTINQSNTSQKPAEGGFGALLTTQPTKSTQRAEAKNPIDLLDGNYARSFVDVLLDHLSPARKSSNIAGQPTATTFGFTGEFTSVFGHSGPLIDWIHHVTASLGLSEEQNLSLQQIAVNNKDVTGTAADVAKIRKELDAAGIKA